MKPNKSWKNKQEHYLNALDSNWYRSIAELQNIICLATFDFFRNKGLKTMFLPVTTNSISSPIGLGSDSYPVEIELFNTQTYLADSMQFMLEYGCRFFPKGTYYLMPSFRGDQPDYRHLCQFYHSEAEIPGSLEDVISLVEEYIRYLSLTLKEKASEIIINATETFNHINKVIDLKKFPRLEFDEAVKFLKNKDGCLKLKDGFTVITAKGEMEILKKYNSPVWLIHMDKQIVPFYQSSIDNIHADCADLLMGIGETVGCGERHLSGKDVLNSLKEHQVTPDPYTWYINMKDKYPIKTSGFGMGTERFLLWLLQHNDIRDIQLLPRFNGEIFIP